MCGAPHNGGIIDCKVPRFRSAQMLCQGVFVPACATCMSKQLSQIYSLAQVSTCYLAHVPVALSELRASRGLI